MLSTNSPFLGLKSHYKFKKKQKKQKTATDMTKMISSSSHDFEVTSLSQQTSAFLMSRSIIKIN